MKNNFHFTDAIITGSVAFDEIMDFPYEFKDFIDPDKLHQINVSFAVDRLEKQIGGTGTNIVYNLRFLLSNLSSIKLFAAIGKDGEVFLEWMKREGMNTKHILMDRGLYTATGKVITDKKDNQIWGFYYGACAKGKYIDLLPHLKKTTLLVIAANHPDAFLRYQKDAVRKKISYLYDPGMALTWIKDADLRKGLLHCAWLVGNDYEIGQIIKRLKMTTDELVAQNIVVITTLGDKGVTYRDRESFCRVPAYKIKRVIDPTGAGDAWRGGFIAGIMEGESVPESLKLANATASFAVESYGTVNHNPTKKEILKRAQSLPVINN